MGKGDKKTRRGKTNAGSYGNVRKHHARSAPVGKKVGNTAAKKAAARKRSA